MKRNCLWTFLLVFAMLMGMLPIKAYAAGSDPVSYDREIRADEEEQEITSWGDLQALFRKGGEFTLKESLTAPDDAEALTVPKGVTVTLDLAGYTLNRNLTAETTKGSVIIVNGTLTVKNTSGDGKITGGYTSGTGGGVWVRSGGSFTLEGGTICSNVSKNVGGGVYISGSKAGFIMTGGKITGNNAKNGGGVGMDGKGSFTMEAGLINSNSAVNNGAGVWIGMGTVFTMTGGSIYDGLFNNGGTFDHEGGQVGNVESNAHEITTDVTEGGSVTVKVGGNEVAEACTGDVVTVEVAENDDYQLKSLMVTTGEGDEETEVSATPGENGTYTFLMPAENVKVSAEFGQLYRITTGIDVYLDSYNTYHGCTVTADKDMAVAGETVTLTLDLKPGYEYHSSDVNYQNVMTRVNDTTFTFMMPNDDADAYIHIQKAEYKVSLAGDASSNVKFQLDSEYEPREYNGPFPVDYNKYITVIFYPFDKMIKSMTYSYTENGKTVTNSISYEQVEYTGAMEGSFLMPASNVTVHVEYNEIHNVIEEQTTNGIILADVTKAAEGSTVTVYASPDERYAFSAWNFTPAVTLLSDTTDSDGTRIATFTMPNSDVTFSAAFIQKKYDIVASAEHGKVNVEGWAEAGSNVSFTLTPDQYYAPGSVTVTGNGETIGVTEDHGTYTFVMPETNVEIHVVFYVGEGWHNLWGILKQAQSGTITLQHDYTAEEGCEGLYLINTYPVTIDLNGHVIDGTALASAEDVPDAVLLLAGNSVTLEDSGQNGEIKGAGISGAVYLRKGSLTMNGGTLSGSNLTISTVVVDDDGDFVLNDGKVTGNSCNNVISVTGNFTMSGGEVSGIVEDAGIVGFCFSDKVFHLSGGRITGSSMDGQEVYAVCLTSADMVLSGSPDLSVGENGEQGIYLTSLYEMGPGMINVAGSLSNDLSVGVKMDAPGVFVKGSDGYVLNDADISHFASADPKYRVRLNDEKFGELVEPPYEIAIPETENGTVTASVNGRQVTTAFGNETIDLTVSPAPGYRLKSLAVSSGNSSIACDNAGGHWSFTMSEGNVTVNAVFEKQTPSFANMSLLLSGKIVMRFYMDLPILDGVDYTTSYMTFDITHGTCTSQAQYNANVNTATDSGTYYGFDCSINSIQMAEPVKATFCYQQGEEWKTVEYTIAAKDYFAGFDRYAENGFITDPKTINLVHALADYGHYVQPFLANERGWVLGTDYAEMKKYYASSYDITAIQNATADKAIYFANHTGGDITRVYYSLTLDSNTTINLYIAAADTWQGTLKAQVDDGQETVVTKGSGDAYYHVKIEGIAAHQLSSDYTILLTTGEDRTATIKVSALSYVSQALSYYTDPTAQYAVASLYAYSKAADEYMDDRSN